MTIEKARELGKATGRLVVDHMMLIFLMTVEQLNFTWSNLHQSSSSINPSFLQVITRFDISRNLLTNRIEKGLEDIDPFLKEIKGNEIESHVFVKTYLHGTDHYFVSFEFKEVLTAYDPGLLEKLRPSINETSLVKGLVHGDIFPVSALLCC